MTSSEAGGGLMACPMCGDDQPHFHNIEPHTHSPVAGFMPDHPGSSYVECTACCTAVTGSYPDGALAIWNTRSLPAAAQALRERGWTVLPPGEEPLVFAFTDEQRAQFQKILDDAMLGPLDKTLVRFIEPEARPVEAAP